MSGFETLDKAIQPVPLARLDETQVAWPDEAMDDEAALGMVLGDVQRLEGFAQSHNLAIDLERADNNFRAMGLPKNWPGSESARAGLSMPIVMEAVEKLIAAIHLAFFSDKQPFLVEPLGKTTPAAARAKEKLLMWAVKESGFKEEIRKCLKSCLLYGFTVGRWGWKTVTRSKKTFSYEAGNKSVKKESKDYEISHPTFENVSLRNVLIDPALKEQDVRKGRFVIAQLYPSVDQVDALRNDDSYKNIPSRDELVQIMASGSGYTTDSMVASKYRNWRDNQAAKDTDTAAQSVDPLKDKLEILEYVMSDGRVVSVLQRCIVIRNDKIEQGRTTFLSCAFIDVPDSCYGFGASKLLAGEQYLQTSVANNWLDVLALMLNPAFTAEQGLQVSGQNVKVTPGKVLTGQKLTPIAIPDVSKPALDAIATSEARAARRVGTNGGADMPTQALRTAEGVNSFGQDVSNKLQYFIEIFAELVFIPALEAFLEVIKDNLQPSDIQNILSEVDGKAYEDDILQIYNGTCSIQVLSSTKLAARRAAVQLVTLLLQLAAAPGVQEALAAQGQKFNFAELIEEAVDLAGWDCDALIVKATPQEIQRAMTMAAPQAQAQQIQAQAASSLMAQKHADDLEDIQEQGLARAGVKVIDHLLKTSTEGAIPGLGGVE